MNTLDATKQIELANEERDEARVTAINYAAAGVLENAFEAEECHDVLEWYKELRSHQGIFAGAREVFESLMKEDDGG